MRKITKGDCALGVLFINSDARHRNSVWTNRFNIDKIYNIAAGGGIAKYPLQK